MFKFLKKVMIIASLSIASITTITIINSTDNDYREQPSYIESIKLDSSRFTQVDDLSLVKKEYYIEIENSDELVAENDNLRLYYDEDIVSFKIENKNNGYVFSTHIPKASAGTYTSLLSSGIGIEYIQLDRGMSIVENVGISDIAFTQEIEKINNGVNISLNLGGFCSTRICKNLYPGYLEGEYTLEEMQNRGFIELKLGFDLQVTLQDDGIKAHIPFESIKEEQPDLVLLSSIIVFPGLGATKMDEIPGYMMLPDGAGALVRYEDNQGRYRAPYRAQFYGLNYGLTDNFQTISNYPLSMPIFGVVHGVNQNGLLGIIEDGDYASRLFMFVNGVYNLNYNLIFPKFDFKKTYLQSFSIDGNGGDDRLVDVSNEDVTVLYKILDDDYANYVGMGNTYKKYLDGLDTFENLEYSEDIPIQINYLMSDSKKSLLGSSSIEMSTVDDIDFMHSYFLDQGIENFFVSLMGWNEGGYSGHLPSKVDFENSLGSNSKFIDMIRYLQETSDISLINNYVISGSDAGGIQDRRDIAKAVDRFRITFECPDCVYQNRSALYPESSYNFAMKHFEDYQELGVNVLFESLGNTIFSYYDEGYFTQVDSIKYYLEIMELYDNLANYEYPNSYAYKYTNAFMKTPMFNSQLNLFDDLVPLLQIVLMSEMPMFSNYLNFNSYGKEFLLQLVDFNVYPAYVLSMNEASNLKNTDIEHIYTSQFDLWKETVVEEYEYINNALKLVIGESLVSRVTLIPGLVKNTYSNGVIIYINYTSKTQVVDDVTIESLSYALGGDANV